MGASVSFDTLELFKNDWIMLSDFFDMWCGDLIGNGSMRRVFQFTANNSLVVKIDTTNGGFHNVSEYEIWHGFKSNKEVAKYLAPCIQISNAGKIMLQKKTTPIKDVKLLPKKVPAFMADLKVENWGMLNGIPVCHDYANHKLFLNAKTNLVTADWATIVK